MKTNLKDTILPLIAKRKAMDPNDPAVTQVWQQMTDLLVEDEQEMIAFLHTCDAEAIHWLSEIFEDISEHLRSHDFIKCIETVVKKFPEDKTLQLDVDCARAVLER